MAGRDWLAMRPGDFDAEAEAPLPIATADALAVVPADDGCGTGDLLAELPD